MILLLSLIFGIVPLLGIAWIVMGGWLATVDGLFMTLILLTLSGVLMLNAVFEARVRGLGPFRKETVAAAPRPQAQAAAAQPKPPAPTAPGTPAPAPPATTTPAQKTG